MSAIDATAHLRAALLTSGTQLALAEAGRLASHFLNNLLNDANLPPDVDGRLRGVAHDLGTILAGAAEGECTVSGGGAAEEQEPGETGSEGPAEGEGGADEAGEGEGGSKEPAEAEA